MPQGVPFHDRNRRLGAVSTIVLAVFVWCGFLNVSHAQMQILAPNTTIRGDILQLRTLPFLLRQAPCGERDCTASISPINLALFVDGYGAVRVVFTEAEDTRLIRRELPNQSVNDIVERPVLLRGVGVRRHAGREIEFPVAGTIYQDGTVPELEVALTHLNRRAPDRVVIARAPLVSSSRDGAISGRSVHPSSYAFSATACGTHDSSSSSRLGSALGVTPQLSQKGTVKLLYLGTDFDRDFMRVTKCKTASQCNNRIVSFVNQASVYYQRQLNMRLRVDRQFGPVTFTQGTADAGGMLDDYGAFIESNQASYLHDGVNSGAKLIDGLVGFTGKKMLDGVIGIAWMGVFCDNSTALQANMVIRQYSDSLTGTTVAHELGHNLNATHTASGIMAASASNTGRNPRFTSDSVEQISTYANGWFDECRAGVNYSPGSVGNP